MNNKKQSHEEMMASALRYQRGLELLSNPDYTFTKFNTCETSFYVERPEGDATVIYIVSVATWSCSCPDYARNKQSCKHLHACEELLKQEAQCANAPEEEYIDPYIGSNIGGYDY